MKLQKAALALFGLFGFSIVASAQNLDGFETKPPYLHQDCAVFGTDPFGTVGLVVKELTVVDAGTQVKLDIKSSLRICTISTDGQQTLSWKDVNPYEGFDIQYYDVDADAIALRHLFIDPAKPYNRMAVVSMNNPDTQDGSPVSANMTENSDDTFSGTLLIDKSKLLTPNDFRKLNAGERVQKRIELYQISNFTAVTNGVEEVWGDQAQEGRVVFVYFVKVGETISVQVAP